MATKANFKIQEFENKMFGTLRVAVNGDKVLFCLKDVCNALGLGNVGQVTKRLNGNHITTNDVVMRDRLGINRLCRMQFVTEPNLYRCIFQSRKQEAQRFQDWVFEEVLPQIRRTGGYIPVTAEDTPESIEAKALEVSRRTVARMQRQMEADRPMVQLGRAVYGTKDSILLRDLAKLLTQNGVRVGQTRMFHWLRRHGYIFQQGTSPRQEWVECGIFEVRASASRDMEHLTTLVTGKGQEYFINGFLQGRLEL